MHMYVISLTVDYRNLPFFRPHIFRDKNIVNFNLYQSNYIVNENYFTTKFFSCSSPRGEEDISYGGERYALLCERLPCV